MARIVRQFQRQARFSRGTAAEWTAENPVLFKGEPGLETDTRKFKFGDGETAWNSLSYAGSSGGVTDHGDLTGLADDDHPQYLTEAEGDAAYSDITEPIAVAHRDDTTNVHDHGQLDGLADDDHPQYETSAEAQAKVDAHTGDAADAHDASAISILDAGGDFTATDVEGALDELQAFDEAHVADADPHTGYLKEADFDDIDFLVGTATGFTAAEIVVGATPNGELGGTWGAITVDATHSGSTHSAATDTHIADAVDAHDASAVSFDPTGLSIIVGTDVQTALEELDAAVGGGGVTSIEADGAGQLSGAVTFSEGTGITLTTVGQDIEIAAAASPIAIEEGNVLVDTATTLDFGAGFDITVAASEAEIGIDLSELSVFTDHSARHEDGGADEISLTGLSGDPAAVTALRAVDFLVGTATGELSGEIVAGTSPGGELGGTWGSPTVDATHSGSTHSAATDTHIADAADAHDASAISIVDAGGDFTATDVEGALDELQADNEAHVAAADPHAGYRLESADHSHASAGLQGGTIDHGAITGLTDDDHTQYRLESADHTHASTGAQAGQLDHGTALTGLSDDDHPQYVLESLLDAEGDLYVASAADTPARLARGSDDQVLRSTATSLAWESPPFSISFVMSNNGSAIPTGIFPVWVAAFPCTVTAVKAYVDTGTTTVVNAGTGTPPENSDEDFCSADITIDPADAVESGTVNQNQAVAAGEIISVEVKTAGTATQLLIQIDLTRP